MAEREAVHGTESREDALTVPFIDLVAVLPRRELVSARPGEVRLGPDRIEWSADCFQWQPGAPANDCLYDFVALADADDPDEFMQFAQGHGVLGLTEDAVPAASAESDCPRVADDPRWRFERIADWRAYARNARMLMILADALKRGRLIDPVRVMNLSEAEWLTARQRGGVRVAETAYGRTLQSLEATGLLVSMSDARNVQHQRRLLADWLEFVWLDRAMIFPAMEWGKYQWQSERPAHLTWRPGKDDLIGRLSLKSRASGHMDRAWWPENMLFDVLTAELVNFICSDRRVTRCDRCGRVYEPKRIRTDQANYCIPCRLKVRRETNRKSARSRYERLKDACQQLSDTQVDTLAGGLQ
jgi:hypothetical protein